MDKSEIRVFWIGLIGTAILSFVLYRILRSRQEIAPKPLLITRMGDSEPVIIPERRREKDPLTSIHGIGPVTEQKLNEAGIMSFSQLAEASPTELEPFTGSRWDPEDWKMEALELSKKD